MKPQHFTRKHLAITLPLICTLFLGCKEDASNVSAQSSKVEFVLSKDLTANSISSTQALDAPAFLATACFKRLRLKLWEAGEDNSSDSQDDGVSQSSSSIDDSPDSEDGIEDSVDFNIGLVEITDATQTLGSVVVPHGRYRRVEFDLEPGCGGAPSLNLQNNQGTFTTSDRVTIRFRGDFVVDGESSILLGLGEFKDLLAAYDGSQDLSQTVGNSEGLCHE